jgi:hypothetical protein
MDASFSCTLLLQVQRSAIWLGNLFAECIGNLNDLEIYLLHDLGDDKFMK